MKKKLCASCCSKGLTSFERACAQCKARKPRGVPFSSSTPPTSPALSRESSGLLLASTSPALNRESSSATPPPAAQVQRSSSIEQRPLLLGAIAAAQERQASPSDSGSLSGSPSTSPTNKWHEASHQVDDVFVEDAPEASKGVTRSDSDEGTQEQLESAGNDDGLEAGNDDGLLWLISPDEIAQQFSEILSSWEASKRV
jgi:hypothetical protein